MPRLLVALVAVLPALAVAADLEGKVRVSAGGGYDSNAKRDADAVGHDPDGFVSLIAGGEGRVFSDSGWQLSGNYEAGARKFFLWGSEDVLVQNADAEASVALGKSMGLGARGHGRDRHGRSDPNTNARDYTDLLGGAFFEFVPDDPVDVQLYANAHRFIYWPQFTYSFRAPEFGTNVRYRFDKRHSISVFGEVGFRTYNDTARENPAQTEPASALRPRTDSVFTVGAGYTYRGPVPITVTYSYFDQSSNSYGESLRRHRIAATAGVRLPAKFFFFAAGQIQFSSYPQGFRLSPELVLDEESENHNSFSLKLVRPLAETIDIEARFAWYQNVLPHFGYHRQLYWVGLTWRR